MPDDESPPERPDDEFRDDDLPPHPFDRPWFHPSELTALTTPSPPNSPRLGSLRARSPQLRSPQPRSPQLRSWVVPVLTAIGGATVTVALVAAGAFEGDGAPAPRSSRAATATAITAVSTHPAERAVIDSGSSVVAVRVASGGAMTAASGVALASDRVLTAASLVTRDQGDAGNSDDATITISTVEGDVLRAHIMGIDPETDLALLSLSSATLSVARLARDDRLTVGQSVLALGAVGGSHRWVSQGVIAGLNRLVATSSGAAFAGLIETDIDPTTAAAGGSLVNDDGEVVGILSRVAPGHALPIDLALDVADQLATNGRARHGWLGVVVSDAPDQTGGGAKIEFVVPEGPADIGGLAPGDIVSSFGADGVTDMADFMAAQLRRKPGDPVMVMVWRDGKKQRVQVSLGWRSDAT